MYSFNLLSSQQIFCAYLGNQTKTDNQLLRLYGLQNNKTPGPKTERFWVCVFIFSASLYQWTLILELIFSCKHRLRILFYNHTYLKQNKHMQIPGFFLKPARQTAAVFGYSQGKSVM